MAGLNLDLLAGLFAQMTRMTELIRVRKILSKKPQSRTKTDLKRLVEETSEMTLLSKRGEAAHLDMCYGVHLLMLEEGDMINTSDLPAKGECYMLVLSGRVYLETTSCKPYDGAKKEKGGKAESKGPKQVTEQEMLDLFKSIDLDDGGTIDVEELGYALEMMGIQMSQEKVEELMDGVDEDGSGELDFEEFKMILQEKLGIGKVITTDWELKGDKWSRYCGENATFGENSVLTETGPMRGKLMATEDTDLVYITKSTYLNILENGFGGDLTKKVNLLKVHNVAKDTIVRSDYKRLAHACSLETIANKTTLAQQGTVGEEIIFLCGGTCKVQEKREIAATTSGPTGARVPSESGVMALRKVGMSVHRTGNKRFETVDLAYLSAGDLVGGAALRQEEHMYSVVAVPGATILRVKQKDIHNLLHPADVAALKESTKWSDEWRQNHSKASQDAASRQLQRAQTLKQLAQAVEDMGPGDTGKSKSLAGPDNMEMLSKIVDSGVDIGPGMRSAGRVADKLAAISEKEERTRSSPGFKGHMDLNNLSSNPRKLREQLGAAWAVSKSSRWKRVQNTVSAIGELKHADADRRTTELLSMLGGVATGKVGVKQVMKMMRKGAEDVNTILSQLAKEATKELSAVMEGVEEEEGGGGGIVPQDLLPMSSQAPRGPRSSLPMPISAPTAGALSAMRSSLHGLQLPQLMGRRGKGKVEIVSGVSASYIGGDQEIDGPGGFMDYVLGATEASTVAFPWRKDEPKLASEEERAEQRERKARDAAAQEKEKTKGKTPQLVRSNTFKQLETMLDKTMQASSKVSDMGKMGVSKGQLKKLKRTIGVIMWLKSRTASKCGVEDEGVDGGEADDAASDFAIDDDGPGPSAAIQEDGNEAEGDDTLKGEEDGLPRPPPVVPKLNLGALNVDSSDPGPQRRRVTQRSLSKVSFTGLPPNANRGDGGDRQQEARTTINEDDAAEGLSFEPKLLPGLEAAEYRRDPNDVLMNLSEESSQGERTSPGSVAAPESSPFLTEFFAPEPDTSAYIPDHREVQGFATHRERFRPLPQPASGMASLPLVQPSASDALGLPVAARPQQPHVAHQQRFGIAYAPGVKPWTPRGGPSPRYAAFHGTTLRNEKPVQPPPGHGTVFPQRVKSPNRGWQTDRGSHLGLASGWAVELPGATIDLLASAPGSHKLPKLLPSDMRTQAKLGRLRMPRGADGSIDNSKLVLKPSCFNARIRAPR